jgi:hypothetical protein
MHALQGVAAALPRRVLRILFVRVDAMPVDAERLPLSFLIGSLRQSEASLSPPLQSRAIAALATTTA